MGPVSADPPGSKSWLVLLLAAALAWHVLAVVGPEKPNPPEGSVGRDYATYHYAVRVALDGGDPYDTAQLNDAAEIDGWRGRPVHPLLYPPASLLGVVWAAGLPLPQAATVFRLLGELGLLLGLLSIVRWWAPLGWTRVLALLAASLALMSGVAYGVHLGQANAHVWGLTLAGLALADDDRPARQAVGGGLVAMAILGKLAPAAFLGVWVLERRWTALGSAVGVTVVGGVLSWFVVGGPGQAHFFAEVLPSLSSGAYNGLTIRIGLLGNHSIPALLDHLFPGDGQTLGPPARAGAFGVTIALGVVLAAVFRAPAADRTAMAGRVGAVGVALLLVPVYTFEHHLLWAIPGLVACGAAARNGRLPLGATLAVGVSAAVLCAPIVPLRRLHGWMESFGAGPALLVEELKLGALLVVFGACAWLGRTVTREE